MELDREAILEALGKIALSRPNDAIALALAPQEQYVPGLDLWGVSEFKISGNGSVEVKFKLHPKVQRFQNFFDFFFWGSMVLSKTVDISSVPC